VRKGIGEGLVEGTGVRLPPDGGDGLRTTVLILDRLLSPMSSGPVLSGRLREFVLEGDEWRLRDVDDETEFRCDTEGCGEGCPLPEDTAGECVGVLCVPALGGGTSGAR